MVAACIATKRDVVFILFVNPKVLPCLMKQLPHPYNFVKKACILLRCCVFEWYHTASCGWYVPHCFSCGWYHTASCGRCHTASCGWYHSASCGGVPHCFLWVVFTASCGQYQEQYNLPHHSFTTHSTHTLGYVPPSVGYCHQLKTSVHKESNTISNDCMQSG